MGRKQTELGALAVSQIRRRGINFVGGVAGLAINVTKSGGRSWILRYQVNGIRRDKGLGGYPDVTLAQAKELARGFRAKLAQGIDPIEEARAQRSKLIASQLSALTFSQAAKQYIDTHEASWRNAKHAQQWRNTIQNYATPVIGKMLVRDIGQIDVLKVLEPIWRSKTETASRLRGRMESIFEWSLALGYRTAPNPARWKGLLDQLLPSPGKIAKTDHHRALPYVQLPEFMRSLSEQQGIGPRALEFAILTASRSGEVRGAKWDEFDLNNGIWVVPEGRMKAGKEHRVPLSNAAVAIIKSLKANSFCNFVFPSSHSSKSSNFEGKPLSDMALLAVVRRMNVDAVPHGFRSSFRDWCAEQTDYSREVAEMALAHTIGNKVEAAYRRGDLLEKRRQLMQDWADFAYGK